ncbi:MAG: phosphotransferase [Alphaproteobacteria bacterium]|nr:phosphotransferase [Alphaproteobacteria bacterium]
MAERSIDIFLAGAGWHEVERDPLTGDASFRRYIRLKQATGEKAMLMDAPPPQEDVRPFLSMARHLEKLDLSAPKILAGDEAQGFLLLEDFGDDTYTRLLKKGADEEKLYRLATDVLINLHELGKGSIPLGLPAYDQEKMLTEISLLPDWYMPAVTEQPSIKAKAEFEAIWQKLFPIVLKGPEVLVLRDYHVDNLMLLEGRGEGVASCGLLDFQDAVAGHPAYDLMSLLEDARRDLAPGLAEAMLDHYFEAFPEGTREEFMTAYAILGAQRHAKVIGIFTRLSVRDNKDVYLEHIPRVWRLLEKACEHPVLGPFKEWLDKNIQKDSRRIPPCRVAK